MINCKFKSGKLTPGGAYVSYYRYGEFLGWDKDYEELDGGMKRWYEAGVVRLDSGTVVKIYKGNLKFC